MGGVGSDRLVALGVWGAGRTWTKGGGGGAATLCRCVREKGVRSSAERMCLVPWIRPVHISDRGMCCIGLCIVYSDV